MAAKSKVKKLVKPPAKSNVAKPIKAAKSAKTAKSAGRKAVINREDIVAAALALVGPNRSISSLSLREIARFADIAPNSFYRHFKNMDELAIAMIELAGTSLNRLLSEARHRVTPEKSAVVTSIEAFMEMLNSEERLLHLLLREGSIGSEGYRNAVEKFLTNFEEELSLDLIRLVTASGQQIKYPHLVSKAITRLVFSQGGYILDRPQKEQPLIKENLIKMVRMIIVGGVQN